MDSVSIVLDFANIVNLIAVLLLMRAIIIDRKVLKGFSVSGSFLTFIAIFGFEIVYVLLGNSISSALGLVNLVFWLMAFLFVFRKWIYERHKARAYPSVKDILQRFLFSFSALTRWLRFLRHGSGLRADSRL
jgi:hypothetical protein